MCVCARVRVRVWWACVNTCVPADTGAPSKAGKAKHMSKKPRPHKPQAKFDPSSSNPTSTSIVRRLHPS